MEDVADSASVVYVRRRRVGREVAVASAAEFLSRILDDAPQPVWVVDEEGFVVFANPAAVAALGYDDAAQSTAGRATPPCTTSGRTARRTPRTTARC